jgi:hypothetical protein
MKQHPNPLFPGRLDHQSYNALAARLCHGEDWGLDGSIGDGNDEIGTVALLKL